MGSHNARAASRDRTMTTAAPAVDAGAAGAAARFNGAGRVVGRRLLMLIVSLLVASFVVYGSMYLAGGNPIATLAKGRTLSPDLVAHLKAQYHLGQPFFISYWQWLEGVVLHRNLGTSLEYNQSVAAILGQRVVITLELVIYSGVLIVVLGVGLGMLSGLRRGASDTLIVALTSISAAVPAFVAAIGLMY